MINKYERSEILAGKSNNLLIKTYSFFTLASIFFMSFGSEFELFGKFALVKGFTITSAIAIFLCILIFNNWNKVYPKGFTQFLLFILLHTFFAYLMFFPNEFMNGGQYYRFYTVEATWVSITRIIFLILFSYSVANYVAFNKDKINKVCFAYIFGFLIVSIFSSSNSMLGTTLGAEVVRHTGGYADPNAYAIACNTSIFLSLIILSNKKKNSKWLAIITLIFSVYNLMLSNSRTGIIGLLCGVLIIYYYRGGKLVELLKLSIIFLIILMILFYILPADIRDVILFRLDLNTIIKDRGAKRFDIWLEYLLNAKEYILWGTGYKRSPIVLFNTILMGRATHNNYLQILIEFGIIGLFLYIRALLKILGEFKKNVTESVAIKKIRAVLLGLYVYILVTGLSIDSLAIRETWFGLALIVSFHYKQKWGKNKKVDITCISSNESIV